MVIATIKHRFMRLLCVGDQGSDSPCYGVLSEVRLTAHERIRASQGENE
jgi:hypothetical protein